MELTAEALSARERQLVEMELRKGRLIDGSLPALREQHRAEWGGKLRALKKAWDALPPDGREFLAHALATQMHAADPATFAQAIDIGAAADEALDTVRGRRVAPVPGLREAVIALHAVWIKRGRPASVRHLDRDRRDTGPRDGPRVPARGPSDLHVFVARHLIELFGRETFSRNSDDSVVLEAACTAADTALTGR